MKNIFILALTILSSVPSWSLARRAVDVTVGTKLSLNLQDEKLLKTGRGSEWTLGQLRCHFYLMNNYFNESKVWSSPALDYWIIGVQQNHHPRLGANEDLTREQLSWHMDTPDKDLPEVGFECLADRVRLGITLDEIRDVVPHKQFLQDVLVTSEPLVFVNELGLQYKTLSLLDTLQFKQWENPKGSRGFSKSQYVVQNGKVTKQLDPKFGSCALTYDDFATYLKDYEIQIPQGTQVQFAVEMGGIFHHQINEINMVSSFTFKNVSGKGQLKLDCYSKSNLSRLEMEKNIGTFFKEVR